MFWGEGEWGWNNGLRGLDMKGVLERERQIGRWGIEDLAVGMQGMFYQSKVRF